MVGFTPPLEICEKGAQHGRVSGGTTPERTQRERLTEGIAETMVIAPGCLEPNIRHVPGQRYACREPQEMNPSPVVPCSVAMIA